MQKKSKFEEFLNMRKNLSSITNGLSQLGINMVFENSIVNYKLIWQESPSILKQIDALDFFDKLNQEEELALALAVIQEMQNNFIDLSQIKTVNKFFDTNIF